MNALSRLICLFALILLSRGLLALNSQDHTPAHEFAFKLSRIKDVLFTATAKEIAEDRHHFMSDFFLRLEREVRGEL